MEVETHWNEASLTLNCRAPFSLLDKHTCDIDPAVKHGVLRIPPGATTRLLNSLKPSPPVEEDEGTPRRAEDDGMDVDPQPQPQAGTSTDTNEQKHEVPGVQLYDDSKSSVCYSPSHNRFVLLKGVGLCLRLESNKHEYSGNRVRLPRHPKLPRRTDDDPGQRMRWYISGTYRLVLWIRPRSRRSHFRTSLTKINGI